AHPDVARGHVGVGTQMPMQLEHQRLAEAHYLAVAPALGIEVRAALAAAHRQRGERVLEGLLEGQELEDRQVDRRMETHAALERTDRRTVLHTPGAIDLHLAAVVDPAHAELDHAFGLDQPLDQAVLSVLGKPLEERPQAGRDFLYRLQELGLAWIAAFDPRQKFVPRKPHLYPLSVSMSSPRRACGPAVKLQ